MMLLLALCANNSPLATSKASFALRIYLNKKNRGSAVLICMPACRNREGYLIVVPNPISNL